MLSVLVGTRFQVLFHSPPGVLFTFPSQYCYSIGHQVVFRLGGWSPRLPTGFHVSGGTLDTTGCCLPSPTGLSPSLVCFPTHFGWLIAIPYVVRTPKVFLLSVWPPPRSLATTSGISVDFFSSPYLDVSVQAVPHVWLCIHHTLPDLLSGGLPHSDIRGYCVCLRLPTAFRS